MKSRLININSDSEEKAEKCREFKEKRLVSLIVGVDVNGNRFSRMIKVDEDKPAAWAFEHEGKFYCFMEGENPSCAREECKQITRNLYSATTGWQTTTSNYHVCDIRNSRRELKW